MINFCGLVLRNPLVIASSPATETEENIEKCVEAGTSAVILKSVGPKKIVMANRYSPRRMFFSNGTLYMLSSSQREIMPLDRGVRLIKEAHKRVSVPIIASVACAYEDSKDWEDTCNELIYAGADMIQMDLIYAIEFGKNLKEEPFKKIVNLAERIQAITKKTVMLKLSPNIALETVKKYLINKEIAVNLLDSIPVGIPIDINSKGFSHFRGVKRHGRCLAAGKILYPLSLLYTQELSKVGIGPICAGGGIFKGEDAVALLLSGAKIVQVATAVCIYGFSAITKIISSINDISQQHGIDFSSDVGIPRIENIGEKETEVIEGRVIYHSLEECAVCEEKPCKSTIMCGSRKKGCEGCGICIDVCPKGVTFFKKSGKG